MEIFCVVLLEGVDKHCMAKSMWTSDHPLTNALVTECTQLPTASLQNILGRLPRRMELIKI